MNPVHDPLVDRVRLRVLLDVDDLPPSGPRDARELRVPVRHARACAAVVVVQVLVLHWHGEEDEPAWRGGRRSARAQEVGERGESGREVREEFGSCGAVEGGGMRALWRRHRAMSVRGPGEEETDQGPHGGDDKSIKGADKLARERFDQEGVPARESTSVRQSPTKRNEERSAANQMNSCVRPSQGQ